MTRIRVSNNCLCDWYRQQLPSCIFIAVSKFFVSTKQQSKVSQCFLLTLYVCIFDFFQRELLLPKRQVTELCQGIARLFWLET